MTKPKPSRVRQPATILRELGRVVDNMNALAGWSSVENLRDDAKRLIAELRRSLAPRTRRGEGQP